MQSLSRFGRKLRPVASGYQTPFTFPPIGNHSDTTYILPYSKNERLIRVYDATKVQIYNQNRYAIWIRIIRNNRE